MRLTLLRRVLALAATFLLPAAAATAAPTTVVLDGFVTESSDADYTPGDPVELQIRYSDDFVSWSNGGPGSGDLEAALRSLDPIADLAGTWTNVGGTCFDVRTGGDTACPPSGASPFIGFRLDTSFEAGDASEQILFDGSLVWLPSGSFPGVVDGASFREAFTGGELELKRGGNTILRAVLVPEPSTALLVGGGLLALASARPVGRTRHD